MILAKKHIKVSIIALLGLLTFGQAWGADLLVKPGFSKDYAGAACADAAGWDAQNLRQALAAAGSGSGLYLCPGTYAGADIDSDGIIETQAANQFIRGLSGNRADVIIDNTASGTNTIDQNHDIALLSDLTIKAHPSAGYALRLRNNATITNVLFDGGNAWQYTSGGTHVFNDVGVRGFSNQTGFATVSGAAIVQIYNYCVIDGNYLGFDFQAKNLITINNSNLTGSRLSQVINNSNVAGALVINNSFIGACPFVGSTVPVATATGASTTLNNTAYLYNPLTPQTAQMDADVTVAATSFVAYPKFTAARKFSIFSPCIDDYASWTYAKSVAQKLYAAGYSLTFMLDTGAPSPPDWAEVNTYVTDYGMDIVCHGYSGTRLDANGVGNAIRVAHATGNWTIAVTRTDPADSKTWSGTITLSTGESLAIHGNPAHANFKTIANVNTWLGAQSGWTGSIPTGEASTYAKAVCLAAVTNDVPGAGKNYAFDQTSFFQVEITEPKAEIESNVTGYTCKVFAVSNGETDETVQDAVKAAGFLGCRSTTLGSYTLEANTALAITGLNIYDLYSFYSGYFTTGGASDAEKIKRIASHLFMLEWAGAFSGLYAHNSTEFSLTDWDLLIALLQSSNVNVWTVTRGVEWVRDNGVDADADGERWTIALTDTANYIPKPGSPLIGAGVFVTGVHGEVAAAKDFAGTDVTWGPSIGAYHPTGAAPIWANLNGAKLLRASQAVTITGDHSAETLDLSNAANTGTLTVTGAFSLGKVIGNAAVPIVGSNARVTGALELGDNAKLHGFMFVHE